MPGMQRTIEHMILFVTGIGTDVGKTIVSAILTEALEADYWKPIQAGDLDHSDTHKVMALVSNSKTHYHDNSYALKTPASPHLAADMEGIRIDLDHIVRPKTANHLIVEGAGGLFVPLNETDSVIDLIRPEDKVVLVSRHYLGSINHTLLSVEALRHRNIPIAGLVFNGDKHPSTESVIITRTGLPLIGSIDHEPYFDPNVISEYAARFRENLLPLL